MKGIAMKKSLLVVGGVAGFVLGSRSGRGPYEKIEAQVKKVASRPDVREAVGHVQATVRTTAAEASDAVKGTVEAAGGSVEQQVDEAKTVVNDARATASDKAMAAKRAVKDQFGSHRE
jgi:hypothetical protein